MGLVTREGVCVCVFFQPKKRTHGTSFCLQTSLNLIIVSCLAIFVSDYIVLPTTGKLWYCMVFWLLVMT